MTPPDNPTQLIPPTSSFSPTNYNCCSINYHSFHCLLLKQSALCCCKMLIQSHNCCFTRFVKDTEAIHISLYSGNMKTCEGVDLQCRQRKFRPHSVYTGNEHFQCEWIVCTSTCSTSCNLPVRILEQVSLL